MTAGATPQANIFPAPQAYDLTDERELRRLFIELRGYLRTSHGIDRQRRQPAIDALDKIIGGEVGVMLWSGPVTTTDR